MLVVAPLTLYSSFFAGDGQGGSDVVDSGRDNETITSNFFLVQTTADLPPCDNSSQNQIFFIADERGFEVCQNAIIIFPETMYQ